MTELPATIYIGAGAVIAALISGYWSFVNLIVSKDQKVSEFRQNWIDQLRDDVAAFTSNVLSFQTAWMAFEHLNKDESGYRAKFLFEHKSEIQKLSELENRIKLRLNPKDDENIIVLVDDIIRYTTSQKKLSDGVDVITKSNKLVGLTQDLLKSEWERVKKGERGFRYTRNASFVLVLFAVIYGIYIIA